MKDTYLGNSLAYKGKVDIFKTFGKTTLHLTTLNEGLQGISELFTRACLGYSTVDYVPKWLDILDADGVSILVSPVQLRAQTYGTIPDGDTFAGWKFPTFDALVTTDNLKNLDEDEATYYFVLKSNNSSTLARIQVIISTNGTTTSTTVPTLTLENMDNILIRWSLYLTNREAE